MLFFVCRAEFRSIEGVFVNHDEVISLVGGVEWIPEPCTYSGFIDLTACRL